MASFAFIDEVNRPYALRAVAPSAEVGDLTFELRGKGKGSTRSWLGAPRLAFSVGISEYDNLSRIRGAATDLESVKDKLSDLGFSFGPSQRFCVNGMGGRVTVQELRGKITDFVEWVRQMAEAFETLIVFVSISSHGVQVGSETFPRIVCSNAADADTLTSDDVVDIDSELISELMSLRPRNNGLIVTVFVLDCCRTQQLTAPSVSSEASSLRRFLPIRRSINQFYFLLPCDPRGATFDLPEGGVLITTLMPLLDAPEPIHEILQKAQGRINQGRHNSILTGKLRAWYIDGGGIGSSPILAARMQRVHFGEEVEMDAYRDTPSPSSLGHEMDQALLPLPTPAAANPYCPRCAACWRQICEEQYKFWIGGFIKCVFSCPRWCPLLCFSLILCALVLAALTTFALRVTVQCWLWTLSECNWDGD